MSPTWGAHCPSPPLPPHKRLSVPILYQNQNQTSPQKAGTALILTAHGGEGPLRGESASLWEAWQARALSGSARPQHRPPSSPPRGGEPIARGDPPSFLAPQGRGAHRPGGSTLLPRPPGAGSPSPRRTWSLLLFLQSPFLCLLWKPYPCLGRNRIRCGGRPRPLKRQVIPPPRGRRMHVWWRAPVGAFLAGSSSGRAFELRVGLWHRFLVVDSLEASSPPPQLGRWWEWGLSCFSFFSFVFGFCHEAIADDSSLWQCFSPLYW